MVFVCFFFFFEKKKTGGGKGAPSLPLTLSLFSFLSCLFITGSFLSLSNFTWVFSRLSCFPANPSPRPPGWYLEHAQLGHLSRGCQQGQTPLFKKVGGGGCSLLCEFLLFSMILSFFVWHIASERCSEWFAELQFLSGLSQKKHDVLCLITMSLFDCQRISLSETEIRS